jgi:hypothetical protein
MSTIFAILKIETNQVGGKTDADVNVDHEVLSASSASHVRHAQKSREDVDIYIPASEEEHPTHY